MRPRRIRCWSILLSPENKRNRPMLLTNLTEIHREHLEPFPFRWNRNGGSGSLFDAFSSREPVSTSLENAL